MPLWLLAHQSQQSELSFEEHHVQATLVFRLLHFVHWPSERQMSRVGLTLCVYGSGALETVVLGFEPQFWRFSRVSVVSVPYQNARFEGCDAVLLGTHAVLPQLINQRGLLTIGLSPDFIDQGGVVALVKRDNRYTFDVNLRQASQAGLYLEAPLVQLSHRVVSKQ